LCEAPEGPLAAKGACHLFPGRPQTIVGYDVVPRRIIVHRPAAAKDRERFEALPEAVVVVEKPPADFSDLAAVFKDAVAEHFVFEPDRPLYLLATGPMLDGPDKVAGRVRAEGQAGRIELVLDHTSARLQGKALRRNIRWRPMVQYPLNVTPGEYAIVAVWQAVESLAERKALAATPLVEKARLTVRAD